ncbi:hypothetical protein ANN_10455 [Periplaneta americana]|uniref:Uncharacterized protein n=1 Tax=Periplaneta americana TaxID=6978 RepID=A0ABQ8TPE3_PERAM|nr:hypothetical protein ANN_10455 [Periplaneta americana]
MAGLCEGGNEPPGSLKASKMDETRIPKMVYEWKLERRWRRRRHQQTSWKENIQHSMRNIGITEDGAQDKDR